MSDSAATTTRARLINLGKIVLTIAAVAYIVVLAKPGQVVGYLATMDWRYLLVAIALKPLTDAIKTRKWQLLARVQLPDFSFWQALRSFYMGLALAVITPFAIGELGRGALASDRDRAELSGLTLLDKVLDLATVALYSALGLALLYAVPWLALLLLALFFLALAYLGPLAAWFERVNLLGLFRLGFVRRLVASVKQVSRPLALRVSGLSLLYFALFYLQAGLIMAAFRQQFPPQAAFLFPVITLSTVLPITIGGVGIREGTAVLLLRRYGIPEAVAFNTFFMHFIIANVLAGLVGALLFVLPSGRRAEEHNSNRVG